MEEVKVPYDQVIEEEYEVLVPKYIDVEVEKEIKVPVKYHTDRPIEQRLNLENDVMYNMKVVVPKKGKEILEADTEVTDTDLAQRISQYRSNVSTFTNENRRMQTQISQMKSRVRGTTQLNSIVRTNADLKAQRSELESRMSVVQKDKERLMKMAREQNLNEVIEYKGVNPELLKMRSQLEGLLNENKRLVAQTKVYT